LILAVFRDKIFIEAGIDDGIGSDGRFEEGVGRVAAASAYLAYRLPAAAAGEWKNQTSNKYHHRGAPAGLDYLGFLQALWERQQVDFYSSW
jgi:hypothetical protein